MPDAALKTKRIMIGPTDAGRRMSLEAFEFAKVKAGYLYELSRGVITVSDVPNISALFIEQEVREQLTVYKVAHADVIVAIAGGSNCKLLVNEFQSERHPDISIYMTSPRGAGVRSGAPGFRRSSSKL